MITQKEYEEGLICRGRGFNCYNCKDANNCVQYIEVNIDKQLYELNNKLQEIDMLDNEISELKECIETCKKQIELKNKLLCKFIKKNENLLRPMDGKDLFVGNRYFFIGDDNKFYTGKIQEIYNTCEDFKNYCGEDGCIYDKSYSMVLNTV